MLNEERDMYLKLDVLDESQLPQRRSILSSPLYTALDIQVYRVGCLHPVACTRSGSGFPSNATLVTFGIQF
jgi:hypothetical protein